MDHEMEASSSARDDPFRSPSMQPNFYDTRESPLSTKREKLRRNLGRTPCSYVPRAVKTAPPLSRIYPRRFALQTPHQVSFRNIPPDNNVISQLFFNLVVAHSPLYNPHVNTPYFEQCYTIERKLGQGSFGEAYAVFCKEDGRRYAVKRALDAFRSSADRSLKLREVQKHELLPSHINLVQFCKAWEENGRLYILTELCERSLLDYCSQIHTVPEKEIWNIFIDVLRAVDHLHRHDLLHVDIKPENIFLTKDKVCKLGDFGLIFDLKNDTSYTPEEGDAKYLAPEVLNAAPTKAADVFSIGITILEVTTDLDLPSRGDTWHQIRSGDIPDRFFLGVSKDLTRLIKWLMSPDPAARPTTAQALSDTAIASRASLRSCYLVYHQTTKMISDHSNTILMWIVALIHLLAIPFTMFFDALRKKKNDLCTTPSKGAAMFVTHTPETNGSIRHERISRWDDDSDSEEHHPRHSFTAMSKRFLDMEDQPSGGDPFPRYRLRFDDDTPSSSSEKNDVARAKRDHTSTPISAFSKSRRSDSHAFTSEAPKYRGSANENWSPLSKRCMDDSDEDLINRSPKSRGTMSCPPYRQPLRSRLRNRLIPRLDFSLVDDSPDSLSSPATNTDSTASSMSSGRSKSKSQTNTRMITGMASSGEDSS